MAQDASPVNLYEKVPVTLICGFLGSGKTSLVNVILNASHQQRIVVVVNEFGEVDIDSRLVLQADDSVIALRNGCICCTVRSDLNSTLHQLLIRRRQTVEALAFDRILIEASGLASPGPAVQSILADPFLSAQLSWDAGITMIHARHIVRQLREHPEAAEQLAYADHIVLNHCDHCPSEDLARAEWAVRSCQPHAAIQRTSHARVDVAALLVTRTWDTVWRQNHTGETLSNATHTHGVVSLSLCAERPVDLSRLQVWLRGLINDPTIDIMRIKGIVRCPQYAEAVVVQGVYEWFDMRLANDSRTPESMLVIIGRGLHREDLLQGWADCQPTAES